MPTTQAAPTIRDLMPAKHLRTLAKRCNLNTMRYMQEVIDLENAGYKYWPEVLKLAEETNPAGFAKWAEANPEKLLKVAA